MEVLQILYPIFHLLRSIDGMKQSQIIDPITNVVHILLAKDNPSMCSAGGNHLEIIYIVGAEDTSQAHSIDQMRFIGFTTQA